jgi:AraC-like DNA-binding protein
MVRLHRAHQELRTTDPNHGDTVTTIATRWGFYHHSRFTTLYRHTYGINPRHTLHNSSALTTPRFVIWLVTRERDVSRPSLTRGPGATVLHPRRGRRAKGAESR